MEFTILNDFLNQSLNLLSVECYQITISGIQHVINENDVIDYSNQFQDEVIEEVYKNLSTIQFQSVPIYFNALFKKIEDYQNNRNWKFYSYAETEKMEHLEWQFNELLNDNSENEELLKIASEKNGFKGFFWKEADKRRLIIIEGLKNEIEKIRDEFLNPLSKKETLPALRNKVKNILNLFERRDEKLIFNFLNNDTEHQIFLQQYEFEVKQKLYQLDENLRAVFIMELLEDLQDSGTILMFYEEKKETEEMDYDDMTDTGKEKLILFWFRETLLEILERISNLFSISFFDLYSELNKEYTKYNFPAFKFKQVKTNEPLRETIQTKNQKLKWKGTPGEFGAIFDLLIDNGYIDLIKDKKNMVRLLHSHFDIKNKDGNLIDTDYLYKCFKDKIKSYPNGYLKIPYSDNYNTDK